MTDPLLKTDRTTVEVLGKGVLNLRPLMTKIGAILQQQAQASFRRQRRGRVPWAPRMTPNVPGIVADLNAGRSPPGRRFTGRPALVDTGRLRNSITFRATASTVTVGTSVKYAGVQQEGGTTKHKLTTAGRARLVELLQQRPDLREDLGWLFKKPEFTVKVRPRRFLDVTPEDVSKIRKMLKAHLEGGSSGR